MSLNFGARIMLAIASPASIPSMKQNHPSNAKAAPGIIPLQAPYLQALYPLIAIPSAAPTPILAVIYSQILCHCQNQTSSSAPFPLGRLSKNLSRLIYLLVSLRNDFGSTPC